MTSTAIAAVPQASAAPADQMARVDTRLRALSTVEHSTSADISRHLIDAGGKRLRPLLVLASAEAAGSGAPFPDAVIEAAVCVEYLHLATLYHDDVLDSAPVRRGVPSVRQLWGNQRAVLGGDLLLTHAFEVAAGLGPEEVLRVSGTLGELCVGQIDESTGLFDQGRSAEEYWACVSGKTASLLATSCWLGARAAGATAAVGAALAEFGSALGDAFQLVDDILDLCATEELIGKSPGGDLRQGVYTLPVLFALQEDPGLSALLVPGIDADGVRKATERIGATGAYRRSLAIALERVRTARQLLSEPTLSRSGVSRLDAVVGKVVASLRESGVLDHVGDTPEGLEGAA
ncbi:polyprenyl synthetase family protein [Kitasatospora viridis]